MTNEQTKKLSEMIKEYNQLNDKFNELKKKKEALNAAIKKDMINLKLKQYDNIKLINGVRTVKDYDSFLNDHNLKLNDNYITMVDYYQLRIV